MGRQTVRIRRIGSVTFGVVLVITGVIFLLQQFIPKIFYVIVLRFWPFVLIGPVSNKHLTLPTNSRV